MKKQHKMSSAKLHFQVYLTSILKKVHFTALVKKTKKKQYITFTKRGQNVSTSFENVPFLFILHAFISHQTSNNKLLVFWNIYLHLSCPGGNQRAGTPFQQCNYVSLLATDGVNKKDERVINK